MVSFSIVWWLNRFGQLSQPFFGKNLEVDYLSIAKNWIANKKLGRFKLCYLCCAMEFMEI